MATQCHRLALLHSTSLPPSSSRSCNSRLNQCSFVLRQLPYRSLSSRRPRSPVRCVSSTLGNNAEQTSGEHKKNAILASMMAHAPEPIRAFPWGTAWNLFVQRVVYNFWTVGKWLAVPVLAVSMLSEISYTLLQEKVFIIVAGLVGGAAFAGMMKDPAMELCSEFETEGKVAWHLVALGLFFAALKFIGPYLPIWGRVSIPHFANGGLWQVIKLVNDWRKRQPVIQRTT